MTAPPTPRRRWHIITSEFPPHVGGVADYTRLVAKGLAAAGDEVHVWCPPVPPRGADDGVTVHPELGGIAPGDLRRVGRQLGHWPAPRHLLVQWVPHGYGYRSMNLGLCAWLWWRSIVRRDRVDIMVHEPYLAFWEHAWRHAGVALVHRLMTLVLIAAAHRVFVAIPGWESRWRPYALGRRLPFTWLPVPSSLPTGRPPAAEVAGVRERYAVPGRPLVGHFGTYGPAMASRLLDLVPRLLQSRLRPSLLLLGDGGDAVRRPLLERHPAMADRIAAPGYLPASDLARHITACDAFVQPYPDGVSSRRTSAMAILSLGTPLVTTEGSLSEGLWRETEGVLLADVGDPDGLLAHLDQLLADEPRRLRLGQQGHELYARRFDVSHTIAALRESRETAGSTGSTGGPARVTLVD